MKKISIRHFIFLSLALAPATGCEKLIEVDPPVSKISREEVFKDDVTAMAAVTGMYSRMTNNSFADGGLRAMQTLSALSADDLMITYPEDLLVEYEFQKNDILPQNGDLQQIWQRAYELIYHANSILESIAESQTLTLEKKDQMNAEALFIRAHTHFCLVNLFGDVPVILTTDYEKNGLASRMKVSDVYAQIIKDLLAAQSTIGEAYPSAQRVRANKAVVTALLARAYLYNKDWENAAAQASLLINDSNYSLEDNLDNVFKTVSKEAIWQLAQTISVYNTQEGATFVPYPTSPAPGWFKLSPELVSYFESGDKRRVNWVGSFISDNQPYYYMYKYKINYGGPGSTPAIPVTEHSTFIRLAEMYLIRSEANAQLDHLNEAISDLDEIRHRAGLTLIHDTNPSISKADLLLAIERERRCELFLEWGHRWFDLARTSRASAVLASKKLDWQPTDVLYPIPYNEFDRNTNLGDQNEGY